MSGIDEANEAVDATARERGERQRRASQFVA
jgi:hypothetical protein